jgi:hypothetical protein
MWIFGWNATDGRACWLVEREGDARYVEAEMGDSRRDPWMASATAWDSLDICLAMFEVTVDLNVRILASGNLWSRNELRPASS